MKKFLLIALIMTVAFAAWTSPAAAKPVEQNAPRIAVRFLPTMFRRLCVGDTLTLNIWTHWEPKKDEDLPGLGPLEPVNPDQANPDTGEAAPGLSIRAQLGTVTPDRIDSGVGIGDHYFQVTYTAVNPGTETVEAILYGDLAVGTKTFQVLDHCDYELKNIGVYSMLTNDGDMMITDDAVFLSTGEFSVDRTSQDIIQLTGSGNRTMDRVFNAVSSEFTCENLPRYIQKEAPFEISGTLALPPLGSLLPVLDFSPIIIPVEEMEIYCHDNDGGDGFGSPLISQILESKVEEDATLLFPLTGGTMLIQKSYANPLGYTYYTSTISVTGK